MEKVRLLQLVLTIPLFLLTTLLGNEVQAAPTAEKLWKAGLTTSVGRDLDPTAGNASMTFEPLLSYDLLPDTSVSLYSAIDRPLDRHENFSMETLRVFVAQKLQLTDLANTSIRATVDARRLHRWSTDGSMLRFSSTFIASRELLQDLDVQVRLEPFGQLNQYAQATNGDTLPEFGFVERIRASYQLGRLSFLVDFAVAQTKAGTWSNSYSTYQHVAFDFNEVFSVGVAHELLTSTIDSSTGFTRNIRVFDERQSHISGFIDVSI